MAFAICHKLLLNTDYFIFPNSINYLVAAWQPLTRGKFRQTLNYSILFYTTKKIV